MAALAWGLVGLGLIVLGVYLKIKDLQFKKRGVPVKLTVKEVKKISDTDMAISKISDSGYLTTFEFDYDGTTIEKAMTTSKKFKVGSKKNGIYLPKGKSNVLSVAGEGFYLAKGGEIFLISFGLLLLFLAAHMIFDFSVAIVISVVLIYFVLFFGGVFFYSIVSSKNKKKKRK